MRPIDADTLIRRICGMKCGCEREECGYDEAGCPKVRDIETAPTISPDEVRGVGMWRYERDIVHDGEPWCSNCGEGFEIRANKMRYCPSCGAKMEVTSDA